MTQEHPRMEFQETPGEGDRLPTLLATVQFILTALLLLVIGGLAYYAGFHSGGKREGGAGGAEVVPAAKVDVSALYKATPELIARGKALFATNCASCHGPEGFGDGPAAAALNPKPRNFHDGYWRYGGGLARVVRTITEGSPGTAMAAFISIPLEDRIAIAHFERSLEPKLEEDKAPDLAWLGVGPGGAPLAGSATAASGAAAAAGPAPTGPRLSIEEAMKKLMVMAPDTGYALASLPADGNAAGARLYQDRCARCHRRTGEGGVHVEMLGSAPYAYVVTPSLAVSRGDWATDPGVFAKLVLEGLPGHVMPANGDLTRDEIQSLYAYTQMLRAQQEAVARSRS
jgi:mono/diheme cytochrome c family protein